jgi:DegV family protein with EDD domain
MTSDPAMPDLNIVTDSGAHFPTLGMIGANTAERKVTVVPNRLNVAGRVYHEGIDLNAEEAMRLMAHQAYAPVITPPSTTEYLEVFDRLARMGSAGIISIHTSRDITTSWSSAKEAAEQLSGHCKIEVIDSGSISTGQALLVNRAIRAINAGADFDEVVRVARGAADRVYSVYYTETMDFLIQNKIMSPSHGILGTMLNIKPFVTIENGKISLIEKVRSRIQAIERLVEFASEFSDIEEMVILQHHSERARSHHNEQTRMLQDRLAVDFPDRTFAASLYGPSLAALIGVDATGLVILESEFNKED